MLGDGLQTGVGKIGTLIADEGLKMWVVLDDFDQILLLELAF